MANPLARVVMNSLAQKSGMVTKRPNKTNSLGVSNLGKQETQILSSLLNKKASVNNTNSYSSARTTVNVASAMQSLDSLASSKRGNKESTSTTNTSNYSQSSSYESSAQAPSGTTNSNLGGLSTLSNMAVGKSSLARETSNNSNRNIMQKVDLTDLVSGGSKAQKVETKTSYSKPKSSITSLGDLAGKIKKVSDDTSEPKANANSYVKSNVLSNLEAYIPKVTLDSIGKKGSLF